MATSLPISLAAMETAKKMAPQYSILAITLFIVDLSILVINGAAAMVAAASFLAFGTSQRLSRNGKRGTRSVYGFPHLRQTQCASERVMSQKTGRFRSGGRCIHTVDPRRQFGQKALCIVSSFLRVTLVMPGVGAPGIAPHLSYLPRNTFQKPAQKLFLSVWLLNAVGPPWPFCAASRP